MSFEAPHSLSRRESPEAPSPPPHHRRKAFSAFMRHLARLKTPHNHHHHQPSPTSASGGYSNDKSRENGHANGYRRKGSNNSSRGSGKQRSNSHPSLPSASPLSILHISKHQTPSSTSSSESNKDNSNKTKPSNQTITTTATSTHSPSAWSSPAPSIRSLTTTLTTITTTAPHMNYNPHPSHHHNPNGPPILFSNPLPSAPHQQSSGHHSGSQFYFPTTAVNNVLTDNASIITLASSSKHRRRRSFDTDASIRALPPASLWGGSRESLPLSVLSSNLESRNPGERSSLYGRLGGDTSSIRGMNSPGFTAPGGEGYFFSTPKECRECIGATAGSRRRGSDGCAEGWDGDSRSMGSTRTASIRSGRTGGEELQFESVEEPASSTRSSDSTQHPLKRNSFLCARMQNGDNS